MVNAELDTPVENARAPLARHELARGTARGDIGLPAIAVVAIAVGLFLDRTFGYPGHLLADGVVLLCWFAARRIASPQERVEQILCVVLATLGELFLCFGWGLYEYRFHNIPLFVPLGHSLIFLAGLRLARRAPPRIANLIVPLALAAVVGLFLRGDDRLGVLLFPLFLLCLLVKRQRRLYAVMFVVSYLVEIAGTRAQAWRWMAIDPVFGLTLTNPPVCAGTFYCVLDLLVLIAQRIWSGPSSLRS